MNEVTTWADGFGTWHASVPITDSPSRDANRARKAIILALEERGERMFSPRDIHVRREHITNHGTVVYVENWSN